MQSATIYTTPTCGYCKRAKAFFKEHNVTYTEKDVTTDPQARDEMVKRSNQMGVPVIDVGGKLIIGFDEPALRTALNITN